MKLIKEQVEDIRYLVEEDKSTGVKNYFIEGIFMQSEKRNKNGRIYPKHILDREMDRYNREYVSKNRGFGELQHPDCFHSTTELLTTDGWKYIKDVSVGEEIYTLSENGKVEINKVTKTYNDHYEGNMISIKGRAINTLVTPNHRFIIEHYPTGNRKFVTAQELLDNRDCLEKVFRHSFIPKTHNASNIQGKDKTQIGKHEINTIDFAEFMGIYLSEGCVIKRKNRNNSYLVNIYQNEGEKADIIREVLKKMPFSFRERLRPNGKAIVWSTHDNDLAQYLFPLGKAPEKYLPKDLLNSLNEASAAALLDMYILGDGRGLRTKKYSKCDVFSTSEKMIDDLSHVAFIAGVATRKRMEIAKDSKIGDRIIKKENKHDMNFCQILTTKGIYLDSRFLTVELIENFSDTVHCVSVDNGTFYARDSGYTFWTGNSPAINLDRVSHMITKLYPDGSNFIGKAKILDTPNGKIVKSLLDAGAQLGVSTRGVGSLKPHNGAQLVQEDFHLVTPADIVADPSAPDAFVQGLREGAEWILVNGKWTLQEFESAQKLIKEISKEDIEKVSLKIFENFIYKL